MPVFTETEYRNHAKRPELHQAWERLPVVVNVGGVKVRGVGPLVELGHDIWLDDLSNAAWGYLESCGWASVLGDACSVLEGDGEMRHGAAFRSRKRGVVLMLTEGGWCASTRG